MKIYDISKEIFSSEVYPNDKIPSFRRVVDMNKGDSYNLTEIELGSHNGTHIDAPKHFIENGKGIDEMDLSRCMGKCTVVEMEGIIECCKLKKILQKSEKRLLIKGNIEITIEAARLMNEYELLLIGVEGLTVGQTDAPMAVHLELLSKEVVILESLNLRDVPCGDYFLSALPIKLGGCDGAPCRAVLTDMKE